MGLRLFDPAKRSFEVIESGVLRKDLTVLTIPEINKEFYGSVQVT